MEISLLGISSFLVIGMAVGFLAGFLGVGGGIIMVPLLYFWAFPAIHIPPEIIVHMCFGTSLAIIIPTSLSSSYAHAKAGNVDWHMVLLLTVPGILGSFLGSTLAAHVNGSLLKSFFGVLLMAISAQMIFQKKGAEKTDRSFSPPSWATGATGFLVGVFSAFLGLGGGVLAVPIMVRFLGVPIHRAVGISISFVLFASIVGTVGYIVNGWGNPHLPTFALGYIHTWGWVLAGVPAVFLAPWGARWGRKTRPRHLRQAFALLLMFVGIRMFF